MLIIFTAILFIFMISLFFGSFFGVLVDRIVRGEQFVKGKSYCETCKHDLSYKDLVPVFSFLFSRGRCRYCNKNIPPTLPLIEITTAIVFSSVVYIFWGNILMILLLIIVSALLILTFFTDLKYQVIPDIYMWAIAVLSVPYFLISNWGGINLDLLLYHLLAASWLYLFFWILHVAFKGKAMGEGDIYLAAGLGLYLGFKLSVVMWFVAFLVGAIIGLILIANKKKQMKSAVPFGPFLILGFVVSLVWGSEIISFYINFLT